MVSFLGIGITVFRAWFLSMAISGAVWGKKLFSTKYRAGSDRLASLGVSSGSLQFPR